LHSLLVRHSIKVRKKLLQIKRREYLTIQNDTLISQPIQDSTCLVLVLWTKECGPDE
jgi:hypothetical protein